MAETPPLLQIKEVMHLLRWHRDTFILAVTEGVQLPKSGKFCKLKAEQLGGEWHVSEPELDAFVAEFHAEEPGRHPPTGVRRTLAVETRHACGICGGFHPLQYHHIIEWNELKHYDPRYMLAVCGACHDRIGNGTIDRKAQFMHKRRVQEASDEGITLGGPVDAVPWDDLRVVIEALHGVLPNGNATSSSQFDFTRADLETVNNPLNRMPPEYFAMMVEYDEPYLHHIDAFLRSTANTAVAAAYFEVVDDLRRRISIRQQQDSVSFDRLLVELADSAYRRFPDALMGKRRTVNRLLSFMYMNCDIGRKA